MADVMGLFLDVYTRRARLYPALLVVLPIAMPLVAWFPPPKVGWGALLGIAVWSGGAMLVTQISRVWGKAVERDLFEAWGGIPTTVLLSHRGNANTVLLAQRHRKLRQLLPDVVLPTHAEECTAPLAAAQAYDACVTWLRSKTRDHSAFPLLFEENCNYGFRRNLVGLKPLGITVSGISLLACLLTVCIDIVRDSVPISPVLVVGLVLSLAFLLAWLLWLRDAWVKPTAYAYAEQLLATIDQLEADQR